MSILKIILHYRNSSSVTLTPLPNGKFTDCVKFFLTVVTQRRIGASPSPSLASSKLDDLTRKPKQRRINNYNASKNEMVVVFRKNLFFVFVFISAEKKSGVLDVSELAVKLIFIHSIF